MRKFLLMIWNSLSSGDRYISYLRLVAENYSEPTLDHLNIVRNEADVILDLEARVPGFLENEIARPYAKNSATLCNSRISSELTLLQDLRLDIRLGSIDSNVGKANDDVEICDDVVPSLQYRRVSGYTLSATRARPWSPHTLTCNVHHLLHEPALRARVLLRELGILRRELLQRRCCEEDAAFQRAELLPPPLVVRQCLPVLCIPTLQSFYAQRMGSSTHRFRDSETIPVLRRVLEVQLLVELEAERLP